MRKKFYIIYFREVESQPSAIYEIWAEDKERAKDYVEWLRDGEDFGPNASAYEAEKEIPEEQIKFFRQNIQDLFYRPWVEREA